MPSSNSEVDHELAQCNKLERELDSLLGLRYWEKFYGIMYWSNISLPVNITITVLSTITAADASSSGFFSSRSLKAITIITAVLSTLNTFFRPHDQVKLYQEALKHWNAFGAQFENIYYSSLTVEDTADAYRKLLQDVNTFDAPQERSPFMEWFARAMLKVCRRPYLWLKITNPYEGCPAPNRSRRDPTSVPVAPTVGATLSEKPSERPSPSGASPPAVAITASVP